MANQSIADSADSRRSKAREPFVSKGNNLEHRGDAPQQTPSERASGTDPRPAEPTAPRRQPRADDDVQYTTSPFAAPRDGEQSNLAGAPIDPADKPGLVSRTAGTAVLILSAVLAAAAVVLTALIHIHISIPLFLLAGGLVYVGRRLLRQSAEETTDPADTDPGRRREPDLDD